VRDKPKTLEVNSWEELKARVGDARSKILKPKDGEEIWYRGVSSSEYQLLPSLLFYFKPRKPTREQVRKLETNLFFEFLAKARTGEGADLDPWDALLLMQHYRTPTRLLDWTEVLLVALYFAVAYTKPGATQTPRLYLMNPYLWNEKHVGSRDLYWPRYFGWDAKEQEYYDYGEILVAGGADWQYPVALNPPQRDARLSAQRGVFTIHGYDPRPLDEITPELIVAVDLKPSAVKEIKQMLEFGGIDEYLLFPDLEGLARKLKKKYGIG
jgi:hypothetical protein